MITRNTILLTLLLTIVYCTVQAQSPIFQPDLSNSSLWTLSGRTLESVVDGDRKAVKFNAAKGQGLYVLNDFEFKEGSIEFDVKGKNVDGRSFVGVAFHVQNDSTYDGIYLRPFNFVNVDTIRRWRAVQYIAHPKFPWFKLREAFPGKYENKVKPVPNPDEWFHVKVTVAGKNVQVFVNGAKEACLSVEKLSAYQSGKIGLWVGEGSDGSFANLSIRAKKP
jgi:Domain of Unknown Function (DUF1080)